MAGNDYPDDVDTPLEEVTAGVVISVTLLVGFGLLFAGFDFFWVAFAVGFAGILPAAMGVVKYYQRTATVPDEPKGEADEALDELRRRYARGELTEAEFERRVERLLETESVGEARLHVGEADESGAPEPEYDRRDAAPERGVA
jgi:uncharacterized membrane protein